MKKSFHFLWISQVLANLGDVFYIVGLVTILYREGHSAFLLALLPFLNTMGRMISGSLSPFVFNRFRLLHVLTSTQFAKTILLSLLVAGAFLSLPLAFIFVFIFIIAFLDGVAQPASAALIPRIVDSTYLLRANSILSVVNEMTSLGAWAVGGIIVALSSGEAIIILTFILFVLSSFCLVQIVDRTPFEKTAERSKKQELVEGFLLVWHTPSFRSIQVMLILEALANVVWVAAIMYIFVANVLHESEAWWGYMNTTFFVGLLIGGLLCTQFEKIFQKNLRHIVLFSSLGVALTMLALGYNTISWIALVLSFSFGVFEQLKSILLQTWLQLKASDDTLVKVYSAQSVLTSMLLGFASLLAGALAELFSVHWLFIGAGILLLLSASYFFIRRHRFSDET